MKKIRIVFGCLLMIVSMVIFFYPDVNNRKIEKKVEKIEKEIRTLDQEPVRGEEVAVQERDPLYEEMTAYNQRLFLEGQNLEDSYSYEAFPEELVSMSDQNGMVGYVEIPDMDVTLPLYIGASEAHLSQGAGILSETSMPIGGQNTNCVIAAHRGWRGSPFFQHIQKLETGSYVYIQNLWEKRRYQVIETKIIKPEDIDAVKIQKDKDMITLLSCHPYGVRRGHLRYVVYCEYQGFADQKQDEKEQESSTTMCEKIKDEKEVENVIKVTEFNKVEQEIRWILPLITVAISLLILFIRKK